MESEDVQEITRRLMDACVTAKAVLQQGHKLDLADQLLVEIVNNAVESDFSEIGKPIPKVIQLQLAALNEVYLSKGEEMTKVPNQQPKEEPK